MNPTTVTLLKLFEVWGCGFKGLGFKGFGFKVAKAIWGFPKIRGTILGVPIIRIIIYWGLYWGPSIFYFGKLPFGAWGLGFKGLGFKGLGFRD